MRPPRNRATKLEALQVDSASTQSFGKAPNDSAVKISSNRLASRAVQRGPARCGSESPTYFPRMRPSSAASLRRKRPAAIDADSEEEEGASQDSPATCTSANHNKYCHFCQHVKVRASSMLACENQECCRRFCEHCLLTHLNEDVDPMSSEAWSLKDGKPIWLCPICRTKCCCSVTTCEENHRHCKAYRYRRRRAELATKRMTAAASHAAGEKRGKKGAPKTSTPKTSANNTPTMSRPNMSFGFVRSSEHSTIDSPPIRPTSSQLPAEPAMARPRREATLKRRSYALQDDDDDEEEEQVLDKTEASTPRSEEIHNPVPLALPPQMHKIDVQAVVENCVWAEVRNEQLQGMHSDMQYRSDADDDADHLMLGGIYGHMSQFTSESNASMDLCGSAEEMLLDDGMCTAELDEARWLRRTYETVYNPSARQLALQALTGEADLPAPAPAQPPIADCWLMAKQQQSTGPAKPSDSDSEMQYMVPQQPKMVWNSNPSATRKCTVLYDFV